MFKNNGYVGFFRHSPSYGVCHSPCDKTKLKSDNPFVGYFSQIKSKEKGNLLNSKKNSTVLFYDDTVYKSNKIIFSNKNLQINDYKEKYDYIDPLEINKAMRRISNYILSNNGNIFEPIIDSIILENPDDFIIVDKNTFDDSCVLDFKEIQQTEDYILLD